MKHSQMLEAILSLRSYGCGHPNCHSRYGCVHILAIREIEQKLLRAVKQLLRAREGILSGEEPEVYLSLDSAFIELEEQVEALYKEDASANTKRIEALRQKPRKSVGRPREPWNPEDVKGTTGKLLRIETLDEKKQSPENDSSR